MHQNVSIFGLQFNIDPVAFTIPGLGWDVYWYGVIIATGFVLALVYAYFNVKRFGLDVDKVIDVVLVAAPVAVLCARLYYVLFDGEKATSIKDVFNFSGGGFQGLAIYGAVIGALLSGFLMCKIRKVNVLDMFDLAAIGFLIGQGVGRWGNFMNQEAFGANTTLPWGMYSDTVHNYLVANQESLAAAGISVDPNMAVHPCFLYEFIWCGIGVLLLHLLSRKRRFKGQLILSYGAWYGTGRFFIEGLRLDSLMLGAHIRVSQLLSGLAVVICLVLIGVLWKRSTKNKATEDYVPMFDKNDIDELLGETQGNE